MPVREWLLLVALLAASACSGDTHRATPIGFPEACAIVLPQFCLDKSLSRSMVSLSLKGESPHGFIYFARVEDTAARQLAFYAVIRDSSQTDALVSVEQDGSCRIYDVRVELCAVRTFVHEYDVRYASSPREDSRRGVRVDVISDRSASQDIADSLVLPCFVTTAGEMRCERNLPPCVMTRESSGCNVHLE
jgi:hypothetical protein